MTNYWRRLLALTLIGLFLYWPLYAQAAPGDLDLAFGTEQFVRTPFADYDGYLQALAVQPDGKILAAGDGIGDRLFNADFALARYNPNGTLDASFGIGGQRTTEFSGFQDSATAMVIQPDGKIILAGYSLSAEGFDHSDFALARYHADGSLDFGFGTGGKVTTDFSGLSDTASAIALQPDGKIIVAGSSVNTRESAALVRYNVDGSLDSSFGIAGKLTLASVISFTAVAVQPGGKIVASGYALTASTINYDFAVVRFNPTGSLDAAFGNQGSVTTDFSGNGDDSQSLALSADGKIIVGGRANRNPSTAPVQVDFAIARYNDDGSLDASFGSGGKVMTDFIQQDWISSIALQSDGKLVALGRYTGEFPSFSISLARYNPNGSLDASFGTAGKLRVAIGMNTEMLAVALQPDGRIIAGGSGFTLMRYNADGSRDLDFHSRGKTSTDFVGKDDEAFAVAIQSDGKIVAAGTAANSDGDRAFALARYNPDGTLDTGFGSGGKIMDDVGVYAFALLVQPDGKIIAGGRSSTGKFALMRFNADGSLDKTFGKRGIVMTEMLGQDDLRALLLQPDGRIIAVGAGHVGLFGVARFVIARYHSDGSLDSSFGEAGKAIAPEVSRDDLALAAALQPDGKIVVAGSTQARREVTDTVKQFVIARFNFDGTPDNHFADAGRLTKAVTPYGSEARALAIRRDGKIVAAGYGESNTPFLHEDFALVRCTADGSLDDGFGAGGVVTTDFKNRYDIIGGIAPATGGKTIVAGKSSGISTGFALAVYNDDGSLDAGFGLGGTVTTRFLGDSHANAMALSAGGKIIAVGATRVQNQQDDFAVFSYEGYLPEEPVSPSYDLCVQDESTGNVLKVNSATGDYQFIKCGTPGAMLTGRGKLKLKKAGCLIKLSQFLSDREVSASINRCKQTGSAAISITTTGQSFALTDGNITNNTCACP